VKNQMKKNKFIFFSAFIIIFFTSTYASAVDVSNVSTIIDSVKKTLGLSKVTTPSQPKPAPVAGKTPAQSQAKAKPTPASATVPAQSQAKPTPASATVPAQSKNQPVPVGANVPITSQTGPTPASPLASTSAETYSYNPAGKPDPFQSFIIVEKVEKKAERKEPTSIFPLQRAEADSYRVVGIAGSEEHRVAIVEDVAKKFYPILKGTRIGLNNGKVIEIMADRVIVEEYDNKKAKRVILKMRKN
jgi:type IV pilus assembly protein PilP